MERGPTEPPVPYSVAQQSRAGCSDGGAASLDQSLYCPALVPMGSSTRLGHVKVMKKSKPKVPTAKKPKKNGYGMQRGFESEQTTAVAWKVYTRCGNKMTEFI